MPVLLQLYANCERLVVNRRKVLPGQRGQRVAERFDKVARAGPAEIAAIFLRARVDRLACQRFEFAALFPADKAMAVYLAEPAADLIAVTFTAILFSVQFKKAIEKLPNS